MLDAKRNWSAVFTAYLKPKMLAMLALGFASGLPFMMFFSKLGRWLTDVGIEKATIGFFYWISLSYAVKFIWAPIVDRVKIPVLSKKLGQRRSWMFLAICGTIAGMLTISLASPSPDVSGSLTLIIIGAFVLTYSGATLDIAVDAWRIESGTNDEQANLAAVYQLGYRFAIMVAGFAMIFADYANWNATYQLTAAMMGACLIAVLMVKEPLHKKPLIEPKGFGENVNAYVITPFSSFAARYGKWLVPILLLVMIYRLSDFTMGVMSQPFYADMGYSKTTVGLITGTFGPWPAIAGAFISGVFCVRYGLMRTLLIGALITIITNGAFAWLAVQENATSAKLFVTVFCDNVAGGFVVTVFIAYMSSLVDRRYAATQYALLSSGYALFCKILAGFSGVLYDAVGAAAFFGITAGYGIPAILIIVFIWRYGPPHALGITEAPDEEETAEDVFT